MIYCNASMPSLGYKIDKKLNFYKIKSPILLNMGVYNQSIQKEKLLHQKNKSYTPNHGAYNPN